MFDFAWLTGPLLGHFNWSLGTDPTGIYAIDGHSTNIPGSTGSNANYTARNAVPLTGDYYVKFSVRGFPEVTEGDTLHVLLGNSPNQLFFGLALSEPGNPLVPVQIHIAWPGGEVYDSADINVGEGGEFEYRVIGATEWLFFNGVQIMTHAKRSVALIADASVYVEHDVLGLAEGDNNIALTRVEVGTL